MIVLQWCKTQILCFVILAYIGILVIREGNDLNKICPRSECNVIFDFLFFVSELAVLFDGITACTVNFLDRIPRVVNLLVHLGMFVSYEVYTVLLFLYLVSVTVGISKRKWVKAVYILPGAVSVFLTICFLPGLEFLKGEYSNYSMGTAVYICYFSVLIYFALTIVVFIAKYTYVSANKWKNLATILIAIVIILAIQIFSPDSLISCIAVVMITVSIYLNMEDYAIHGCLAHYHNEMVMGLATLVENRDDNTGGHIRRSSAYVALIAKNLKRTKKYKNLITRDYLNNLVQSAPMHDIGKIGIPDAILQKPGKLTNEEFERMKEHPVIGGKIIRDTFGHLYNGEYESMAFQVARYHHEKWNGKGYPEGISGINIPLCARIMAVADVFDAVSAKRCYRDGMPLEECYSIIMNGRGVDFDPDIVDAFLMNKNKVEEIYYKI